MAEITNYTTLIDAIKAIAEDDGIEFELFLPTAIGLAEERLFKELDLPDLEDTVTGSLTASTNTLAKPAGYLFPHYLNLTVSGRLVNLRRKTEDFIKDYWPMSSTLDVPKYYADKNTTQFILAPTPNSAYSYELKYSKKPTKLSASELTNFYTTYCSDALLYASMAEVAKFMKAWSQVDRWEGDFARARDAWNLQMFRKRRDDGEVPQNPDGGPNSLKHTIKSNS